MAQTFFSLTHGDQTYTFRKPDIAQVDRLLARMPKAPLSAAIDFTRELALEPEAWAAAITASPALALTAANGILEALGFQAG
ncbi:hypothetical protein [Thermus hydrothermalis]|uniref:hypothetical protein n=1 Tax=Thermus hydrothermalis TaxID=2908148 RepID=UPI001FAA70C6|nr:hypothetical protein [Thermus hydrothermalis]